jgi:hypothetical protein
VIQFIEVVLMRIKLLIKNTMFYIFIILILSVNVKAQNMLINPGFELPGSGNEITDWNLIQGWNSSDKNSGVIKNELYSPVDGKWIAYQKGKGNFIYQETNCIITAGETYTFKMWARSINEAGNTARTVAEVRIKYDTTTIVSSVLYVNAPQLKGVAADRPNDDGANVWVDGEYRHQFADVHMYQPISYDPIDDPWLLIEDSNYEKVKGLGWAVGNIIVGKNKFIYGTRYRDRPGNFYSSIPMIKALNNDGYKYTWSDPVIILSHTGTEFPWVEDPHCFYDEETGRLWMAWGGGICYVSELDPKNGMLLFHPEEHEFYTQPEKYHFPVATWPETDEGWCGDQWSSCWMEGASLYKHKNYWYYLASYGNMNKNYTIRYGRSKNPTGPFFDKNGVDMMKFDEKRNVYGNTILLGEEGNQLVPGHPHIWEEEGKFYLGYDFRKDLSKEHDLMGIRRLYWVNDWPTIYLPVTVSFYVADYQEAIGKNLIVSFRNIGEAGSVMAVDNAELVIK